MKKGKRLLLGLFSLYLVLALVFFTGLGCEDPPTGAPDEEGEFTECSYTSGLYDSDYSSAKVFYPCETEYGPFAGTTMTGGYTNTRSDMDWISEHLVTHGYIVIAMTPNNNLGTNGQWTDAHKAGIAMLKSENTEYGSPIYGLVDTNKLQISGYSKGGGGALLAADDLGSQVKSVIPMAPYMDFGYSLSGITADTMILIGTSDAVASPSAAEDMYNDLPDNIERTWGLFDGVGHLEWDNSASTTNHNHMKTYITSWMKVHLDGDATYEQYIDGSQSWFDEFAQNADTGGGGCN